MITNKTFTSQEKGWLDFFVKNIDVLGKADVIEEQLNNCSQVKRDYSDYFLIMDFEVDRENVRLFDDVRSCEVQVLRDGAPTVLLMLFDEGIIESLEIFYADSEKLDFRAMFKGNRMLLRFRDEEIYRDIGQED